MNIVICGGGIVGLTAANLFAKHSEFNVTLLEPTTPVLDFATNSYDQRVSAIAPSAKKIFTFLNIWPEIIQQRVGIYQQMQVFDRHAHNQLVFSAKDINIDCLGYIIENRIMSKVLYTKLQHSTNVTILPYNIEEITQANHKLSIQANGQTLTPQLLIAALGAKAAIEPLASMARFTTDYKQTALVATVAIQQPHNNIARQWFTNNGILAFLPLAEPNLCSIVWSTNHAHCANLLQMSDIEFNTALLQETSATLGKLQVQDMRAKFKLTSHHVANYVLPQIALLGDCAHTIHPIAGQGLNLGLLDAAYLYTEVLNAYKQGSNIGDYNVLRRYARGRRWHNSTLLFSVSQLLQMFSNQNKGISILRKLGMHTINNSTLAKRAIMQFASGYSSDILNLPVDFET